MWRLIKKSLGPQENGTDEISRQGHSQSYHNYIPRIQAVEEETLSRVTRDMKANIKRHVEF